MPRRQVVITAHNGVHARPVAELVRLVQAHPHPVTLRTSSGAVVDLSSVLALMDLALAPGDAVVLETRESVDAESLLDTLADVLAPRG
ncbi:MULTISPECIES: HPr family phosphocarrier protein [Microbacterium]|uniref:HPr-like nitrogen-regulatory protein NPr n=1 Tax=Microbacterium hydrocarbonoxydans TaxID=273678 RepID=A0A1H4KFI3_9MICO|nr:HPr family phosphocarrier protein [Microbacterium hydrocarbonoxydans]SEB57251.1 HPr-like nitrogen-regulatory protein NPr [Microbacterium hydrocarbonoxydans]